MEWMWLPHPKAAIFCCSLGFESRSLKSLFFSVLLVQHSSQQLPHSFLLCFQREPLQCNAQNACCEFCGKSAMFLFEFDNNWLMYWIQFAIVCFGYMTIIGLSTGSILLMLTNVLQFKRNSMVRRQMERFILAEFPEFKAFFCSDVFKALQEET